MSAYSLSWLVQERDELIKDRSAFHVALSALKQRILEASLTRHPLLHEWSGTRASVGSLEMAVHAIERTIEEMEALIIRLRNGEIRNADIDKEGSN